MSPCRHVAWVSMVAGSGCFRHMQPRWVFESMRVDAFFWKVSNQTLPETNKLPLKMDGWNTIVTIVSFWGV